MTTPTWPEPEDPTQRSWQPPEGASPPPTPQPAGGYGPPPPGHWPPGAFDAATGRPYSDRSKVAAGLLQLLPGFFLCLGGVGRLYAGHTGLGVAQLVSSIVAWLLLICFFWLLVPFALFFGVWLWSVIDGVVLLAGRPVDGQGYLLRP